MSDFAPLTDDVAASYPSALKKINNPIKQRSKIFLTILFSISYRVYGHAKQSPADIIPSWKSIYQKTKDLFYLLVQISALLPLLSWRMQQLNRRPGPGVALARIDSNLQLDRLVEGLNARRCGSGYMARCPAHDDRTPSLSITERDGKVLVKCFGGCAQSDVISALRELGLWKSPRTNPNQLRWL